MGRSVSYATGSTAITYRTLTPESCEDEEGETREPTDEDYQIEFDDILEWVKDEAKRLWPSFDDDDKWLDREDHAILSNGHARIGISEYCGLVSIWLVPRDDYYGYDDPHQSLSESWCKQISNKFLSTFGEYEKLGNMSNGEGVFRKVGSVENSEGGGGGVET